MVLYVSGRRLLTEEQARQGLMLLLEDDLEDSPWMVMGSLQWDAATEFYQSLRTYARRSHLPWFVSGMTPILYDWPGVARKRQLAPDVFVAFVPDRPRTSFDSAVEGFPPFILEVVSPSSVGRDELEKRTAYDMLGTREYALFTPNGDGPSKLAGYRRSAAGDFETWPADDRGWLWSEVLSLFLVSHGAIIRAATRDGQLLITMEEAVVAHERESEARQKEAKARQEEAEARRQADAEIEHLRREIEQLKRQLKQE